jgi:uncharacterized protein (TIGR00159 family)
MNHPLDFTLFDLLDIFLVALLIYYGYRIVKGTIAVRIFLGLFTIYIMWKVVEALNLTLLSEIVGQFISVGVILLIIVFQQEIRKFLLLVGHAEVLTQKLFNIRWNPFQTAHHHRTTYNTIPISRACVRMAQSKTGALIVISNAPEIEMLMANGEVLNARLSAPLLEAVFYKNSPLHDGAVLIRNHQVLAARCVLPVSESTNLPIELGTRHRAALGVTEQMPSVAIIVSEQTGHISTVKNGRLQRNITPENFDRHLQMLLEDL